MLPGSKDLLHEQSARVFVAELPPKYNLQTIVDDGCLEGRYLQRLLSNPLGTLLSESLNSAQYRCMSAAVCATPGCT